MSPRAVMIAACEPMSSLHSVASSCAALSHLLDAAGFETVVALPRGRIVDGLTWGRNTRVESALPPPSARDHEARSVIGQLVADATLAITHDVMLLESLASYREAIRSVVHAGTRCRWLHWLHSLPPGELAASRPPVGGLYVVPTDASRFLVGHRFGCSLEEIVVVPHTIRAAELLGDHGARDISERLGLFEADVVQIFPASAERLEPKGLDVVLGVFAELRRRGTDARLVVATSRSNTATGRSMLKQYRSRARGLALSPAHVAFTPDLGAAYVENVPRATVVELMSRVSNVFLWPSIAETSSLATLEAALGKNLLVLNESLPMLREQIGAGAIYVPFGSIFASVRAPSAAQLANLILNALASDRTLSAQRRVAQAFAPERVLRTHFRPVLERLLGAPATPRTPEVSVVVWGPGSAEIPDSAIARLWKGYRSEVVLRSPSLNAAVLREGAQRARGRFLGVVNAELDVPADAPGMLVDRANANDVAGAALHPIFRRPEGQADGARTQFIRESQYASLDFAVYRTEVLRVIRLQDSASTPDALALELMERLTTLGASVVTLTAPYRGPAWQRPQMVVATAV